MKRRIKQNLWGNWYGYEGNKKVIAFSNSPFESMEQAAKVWRDGGEPFRDDSPSKLCEGGFVVPMAQAEAFRRGETIYVVDLQPDFIPETPDFLIRRYKAQLARTLGQARADQTSVSYAAGWFTIDRITKRRTKDLKAMIARLTERPTLEEQAT